MPPQKRRGLLGALAGVQDSPDQSGGAPVDFAGPVFSNPDNVRVSDDTDSGVPPMRLPTGVSASGGGYTGTPKLDTTNPVPAQVLPQGGMQTANSQNRIDDDPVTRSQGNTFETQAESGANALRGSLIQQMRQSNQTDSPQQPDHLSQLEAEYQKASQPVQFQKPSLLQRVGGFMAGFGHPEYAQNQVRNQQFEENQQREKADTLLQQIETERRTQEMEGAADRRWQASENNATTRATLQQQMEAEKEKAAQESQGRQFQQQQTLQQQSQQAQDDRLTRTLSEQDKRINAQANKQKDVGTWSVQEGPDGKPILFNSKTSETKPATGIQKAGTYQKTTGAANDAINYATDYVNRGTFTGPGDEALMEKFFELAKPSSGFRMTQPQMDMLKNAQSWKDSLVAKARHAYSGTWFSDEQRKQIVDTMNQLGQSKGIGGQGGGKVATQQHIQDYARQKGITPQQAQQEFQQSGYTIQ